MNFSRSWRSIYGVAVTAFALTVSFAAGPSNAQVGPNAQGAARPANSILVFLKRSDVLLSPRFYRKEWRKAFEDFSATKIVWTYGAERFFQDTGLGNIPMQCTLPFWTRAKEPEHEKLVCRTRNGEPVGMQFAGSPVRQYYPDVLAPEWLERQIAAGKSLADRGCRHFMQDDPPLNVSRISQGGCFSQAMSERYERFLKESNLADSRQSLESFQKEVVLNYHRALHAAIRKHVQAISPQTPVTFAGNVTNRQAPRAQWITGQFDFLISELYAGRENLLSALQALRTQSAPLPGVSALTYASTDVALNRVAIAGAYALGMVPVAPWDVYLDAQKGRFFGNPADYSDLFSFVRRNAAIFDRFTHERDGLFATSMVSAGTGVVTGVTRDSAGNMTVRWEGQDPRLQIPAQSTVRIANRLYRLTGESNGRVLILRAPDTIREGDSVVHDASDILVSLRRNPRALNEKVIHVVNSGPQQRLLISLDPSWTPLTNFVLSGPGIGSKVEANHRQIGGRLILEIQSAGVWTIATNSRAD